MKYSRQMELACQALRRKPHWLWEGRQERHQLRTPEDPDTVPSLLETGMAPDSSHPGSKVQVKPWPHPKSSSLGRLHDNSTLTCCLGHPSLRPHSTLCSLAPPPQQSTHPFQLQPGPWAAMGATSMGLAPGKRGCFSTSGPDPNPSTAALRLRGKGSAKKGQTRAKGALSAAEAEAGAGTTAVLRNHRCAPSTLFLVGAHD